ncbi:MAG: Holliday junction branch migration protein RuvA [Polyangiaceae bacterium]|nr:Holliday junction branch migration protein RuvA [Polyangiaceae bacterium]
MIGRLTGRVVEEGADGTLVLDVRGVGYEVMVPLGAAGRARALANVRGSGSRPHVEPPSAPNPGDDAITLFVHTHVREDALLLYGFATREDRAVFRTLIGISSIGPKIAMGILSALSSADLAAAISRRDASKLTSIPGVGKKTAERLVLELKDKLTGLPAPAPAAAAAPAAPADTKGKLLHGALLRMGYRPAEVDRALAALGARVDAAPLDELVREALALLTR